MAKNIIMYRWNFSTTCFDDVL